MDNIAISMSEGEDDSMVITFDSGDEVIVTTTEDIDLSEYVTKLTYLIEKKVKLSFNKHTFEDAKLKLIQETIEKITESFNESIVAEDDVLSEDAELEDHEVSL